MREPAAGSSPRTLTTKRRVRYRESAWRVHEFEVRSGELVWRVAVLRMERSLLLWAGARAARLAGAALGVPAPGAGALATPLLGAGAAPGLARRLAAALRRPAHVCTGDGLDRRAAPLLERALAAEIKAHPDRF